MASGRVEDRVEEFQEEISSAKRGSDLHWFTMKVAERVARLNPGRDNDTNWYEAQDRLLLYTQSGVVIGFHENLLEFCRDSWNYNAYKENQRLDYAIDQYPHLLKMFPGLVTEREKINKDQFIRAQEFLADHVILHSENERKKEDFIALN